MPSNAPSEVEFVEELARVVWDRDKAATLALAAGFPSGQLPDFHSADVFWAKVVTDARNGAMNAGVLPLAEKALKSFPGNATFLEFSKRLAAERQASSQKRGGAGSRSSSPEIGIADTAASPPVGRLKPASRVYVSSTFVNNETHRRTVIDALIAAGMVPVGVEHLTASSRTTVEERIEEVRSCDWLIGIVAYRYGEIPEGEERSLVEIEYDTAEAASIPRLMFVLEESISINPNTDFDPGDDRWAKQAKLDAFKKRFKRDVSPAPFREETLGTRVTQAVFKQKEAERVAEAKRIAAAERAEASKRPAITEAVARKGQTATAEGEGLAAAGQAEALAQLSSPDRTVHTKPAFRSASPTIAEPVPDTELQHYLARAAAQHESMRLVGFESTVRVKIKLDDLYVPLDAMLDRQRQGPFVFDSAQHAETIKEHAQMSRCELPLSEAFTKAKAMDRRGVLVLGDPGSGKTTHLKQVLLKVIRDGPESIGLPPGTVPVFLPLRSLGDRSRGLPGIIQDELRSPQLSLAPDFGERLCRRGKILYLLDGLDEVADAIERAQVSEWIGEALTGGPESYFLVSCRYAGYTADVELDAEFVELHLRPLNDAQMRTFVTHWYEIVERESLDDPELAMIEAKERSKDLLETLSHTDFTAVARVYALTRNPLLLTAICLVHRDRGRLPRARAQLYEDCIAVLLERWRRRLPEALHPSDAVQVLQPVARWMHEESGRRTASAKKLEVPVGDGLATLRHVEMSASRFLQQIRDESGLLTGWGVDEYGFMHLGFQEYLAAQHLRNEGLRKPAVLWALAQRFGDSWWQEVILLMLAQRNPSVFEEFMRALVRQPRFREWHESEMMRLCLNEAAVPSEVPFVELLGVVAGTEDDPQELTERQIAVAKVLAHAMPEALEGLNIGLREHPAGVVRSWWRNRQKYDSRATTEITAPRGGVGLVLIPGGTFVMGSPEGGQPYSAHYLKMLERELNRSMNPESPPHEVTLEDFYLAKTPVTNAQYGEYLRINPTVPKPEYWGDRRFNQPEQPVVGVSWDDAVAYCEWAGLTLPTEAQWEYACRAGTTTAYYSGDTEVDLARAGWYTRNSGFGAQGVQQKEPNSFGLYDMHGNVWEWCRDALGSYQVRPQAGDGLRHQPVQEAKRVVRGGCWYYEAKYARSTFRDGDKSEIRDFYIGFRPMKAFHAR